MRIDLLSDTVTKPSPAMLEAMFKAKVGDDVFDEDPTVKELESKMAAMFGMEAGIFCPSGTMSNQIAIKVHTRPMDEVICDRSSHIYNYEAGGIAFNSACSVRLLDGDRGRIAPEDIIPNINPSDIHRTHTSLLSIENTCNRGGGSIYSLEHMKKLSVLARDNHLKFHLDGARLFNALIKSGLKPIALKGLFDSISICLSKGLGAPVGTVLLGSSTFVSEAKRVRKVYGGAMRQSGYLAAAGLYALEHHIERLKDDHERAARLGCCLEKQAYVDEVFPVETNIVIFRLNNSMALDVFINKLAKYDIRGVGFGPQLVRFVTHLDVDDSMIDEVIKILENKF